jgi:hypothetical protein
MPEEPDVSPEEIEILDRVWRKRIEAKEQERQREAEQLNSIAGRILEALRSRREGLEWAEIRAMFDKNLSDKQIRQALATLKTTALTGEQAQKNGEHSCERWALSAASQVV